MSIRHRNDILIVYFLVIVSLTLYSFHFGYANKKNEAFNSIEQSYYDSMKPEDRGQWMQQLLIKKNKRIKLLEADNVFSKFVCAINLLRQSIEAVIRRVGQARKTYSIAGYPSHHAKTLIKRLLPLVHEDIRRDAYELSEKFYKSIAGANTRVARNLRSALRAKGYQLWRCAATAAGMKKLCNSYMHWNASQAIITYRAYLAIGCPIQFPDIIREKNNWDLRETDMKILNILLLHIREHPIAYERFTLKNGKNVVLPVQDPNSTLTSCL